MKYKDYYQIMGVERDASATLIKQAYRKLAHQYHPDLSKDSMAKEKFQEVGEAYAVLKDNEKRQAYDQLEQPSPGAEFAPPPGWAGRFDPREGVMDDVDLTDLLTAFARAGRAKGGHRLSATRGQDVESVVKISLEQLHRAGEIEVRVHIAQFDDHGVPHRVLRTFRVAVPVGAAHGQRLRLAAKGEPGMNGGPPGDLYVELAVEPHRLYRVSGRDLYLILPLAPWESVLGGTVRVPTLDGPVEVAVAPGTIGGRQLRLAGRGLRSADGSNGSLFAVVQIAVPAKVGEAERALYQQLAAASQFNPRADIL